ncbi:MAG: lipopolysaccharide biosynthesis protein [Longimicrobiales bacterium]
MTELGLVATVEEEAEGRPKPTASGGMRGVGKQALIYGLGIVAGKGIAFLMLPVYTRVLTPADYGLLELVEMTLEVISIVACAQLALGIFRFYHKAESRTEKNAVVSTALLGLGLTYALVGLAGFLAAVPLSSLVFRTAEHADLLRIASLSLAFESLLIVPFAYARANDRSVFFVTVNLTRTLIVLVLNLIMLLGLGLGIKAMLLSSLITNVVLGSWLAGSLIREVGFGISGRAIRDLFRYGAPLMATQIATFIVTFGDRFFLQAAGNPTVVGLYTLAYQFGFLVALFGAMPFMRVWDPKRFSVVNHPDRDDIYARGFIYLNVSLITVALATAVLIDDFLRIMVTPSFYSAGDLVPVILLAYVLQSWSGIQDTGILIRERTQFIMLGNWLAALTALAGYALLIPRFLGWGAAVATVLAFTVRHITLYAISQRLCPIRYRWAPVLRLVGLALLVYALSISLPHLALWASVSVRLVLLAGYLTALWHLDILTRADRIYVVNSVRNVVVRLWPGRGHGKAAPDA